MAARAIAALILLSAAAVSRAQNLLPNPDFNSGTFPWVLPFGVNVGGWTSIDSGGCTGSGSFEAPFSCTNSRAVILCDTCIPITPLAGNKIYLAAEISSSPNLSAFVGFGVYLYSDNDCSILIDAFPSYTDPTFPSLTSVAQRLTWSLTLGGLTVRSVKVAEVYAQLEDSCTTQLVRFDSLFLGVAPLIFDHNFENGAACPFLVPN